jgi:hypothetical protein
LAIFKHYTGPVPEWVEQNPKALIPQGHHGPEHCWALWLSDAGPAFGLILWHIGGVESANLVPHAANGDIGLISEGSSASARPACSDLWRLLPVSDYGVHRHDDFLHLPKWRVLAAGNGLWALIDEG